MAWELFFRRAKLIFSPPDAAHRLFERFAGHPRGHQQNGGSYLARCRDQYAVGSVEQTQRQQRVGLGRAVVRNAAGIGILLASGSVAVPFTGGTSSAVAYLGYAGMAASALQCGNGLYRVNKLYDGKGDELAQLDSEQWYIATSTVLDVISLASAGAALKEATMTYRAMRRISARKATEWLKSMPRSERKRLTENIIRAENPGISNNVLKEMVKNGLYPKRYPTEAIQNGLRQQLHSALNNSLTFVGSGISGTLSAPVNVKTTGQYLWALCRNCRRW